MTSNGKVIMLYGFDIGGTKIELSVFNDNLDALWTKRIATPLTSYRDFLNCITDLVYEADDKFSQRGLVGIGIPGFINNHQRTIYTTNIEVIQNKPFVQQLEDNIRRPVVINNDANCFALSEAFHADFQGYQTVLGVILGTGLGGGIVHQQQIISGANGCTGEFGHIRLPIDALDILGWDIPIIACGCGAKGCCEKYLSGNGFEWLYAHFYQHSLSAPTIIKHYYQGQAEAVAHVERYVELLFLYLAHLNMIIDADLIVIGGGVSQFDALYQLVPKRIANYMLKQMIVPRVEKARYGDAGGSRGAALLCKNNK